MVNRRLELRRIQTSAAYGYGRLGLPSTHRLGRHARTPLYRQREFDRLRIYVYDVLEPGETDE